jgi:hypothetical protein
MPANELSNLEIINFIAIGYHRLISWAFHITQTKKNIFGKMTEEYQYPVIQSMSGKKGFIRQYDNGYCHLEVSGHFGIPAHIFISRNTGAAILKDKGNFIENPDAKLVFRIDKVISDDWNKLTHIVFTFSRNNEKCIAIVDWEVSRSRILKEAQSSTNGDNYILLGSSDFKVVKESDIPSEYKPKCYYAKLGLKAITGSYAGAHKKKVKIVNSAENTEYIFDSHKQACEAIIATKNYKLSGYASYKTMKSSGKKLLSKDGTKILAWTTSLDNYDMIEVYLSNH